MIGTALIKRISFLRALKPHPQYPFPHRIPPISSSAVPIQVTNKGILYPGPYLERLRLITGRISFPGGKELVEAAFSLAWRAHNGVFRKDNLTPYIEHPLTAAETVSEWGATPEITAATLLHDTLEEGKIHGERLTPDSLAPVVGLSVTQLVEGVTELGKEFNHTGIKPTPIAIYHNLFKHSQQNAAVLIIKLADRLHNMQTLDYVTPETRINKARETLYFYVPIADILGMWQVKRELEDLCLQHLPGEFHYSYEEISQRRNSILVSTRKQVNEITATLKKTLRQHKISAEISIEQRFIFELYQRMEKRQIALYHLSPHDVWRINIVVNGKQNCYLALGAVHQSYPPVQEEIRDFIARPRPNKHAFLQSYIITEMGRLLIQIRTQEMLEKYYLGIAPTINAERDSWLNLLLNSLATNENPEVATLYETMGRACYPITVISTIGQPVVLPRSSTALDFAHQQSQGCFLHAVSATINSRPKPLSTPLQEGDIVFIETVPEKTAQLNWLDFLHLPEAVKTLQGYLAQFPPLVTNSLACHYLNEKTMEKYLPLNQLIRTNFFINFLQTKGYSNAAKFIQTVGQGFITNINEILDEFFESYVRAVSNYCDNFENFSLLLLVNNRIGLLQDITSKISKIGIDLSKGFFIVNDTNTQATIILTARIIPGDIGSLQRLQIEQIIIHTPDQIKYEVINPEEILKILPG